MHIKLQSEVFFLGRGHLAFLWSRCKWQDNIKQCVQETSCQNVEFPGSWSCPLDHSRERAGSTVPLPTTPRHRCGINCLAQKLIALWLILWKWIFNNANYTFISARDTRNSLISPLTFLL
jgi:hypothetical protein